MKDGEKLYVFSPNKNICNLGFPFESDQSPSDKNYSVPAKNTCEGHIYEINLNFIPYSLLYIFEGGQAEEIDIEFIPETPVFKEHPRDYRTHWLVYED